MLSWIAENTNWVFNGIGVTILVAIAASARFFFTRRNEKNSDGNTPVQTVSISGNVSANENVNIQQAHVSIVSLLTIGLNQKAFNRNQSEQKKDMGRARVQEWGRKMSASNEWDWHLLGHALEYYFDAIRADPSNQHPWTNVAYVFHVIGDSGNAEECLRKAKDLAGPGPNYPGRNYKQVERAVKNKSFITGGQIHRPDIPGWFNERYGQYLRFGNSPNVH